MASTKQREQVGGVVYDREEVSVLLKKHNFLFIGGEEIMKKKKFINILTYPIKRSKYNPLRYIFGLWTMTGNIDKWMAQQDIDIKDIYLESNETQDHI